MKFDLLISKTKFGRMRLWYVHLLWEKIFAKNTHSKCKHLTEIHSFSKIDKLTTNNYKSLQPKNKKIHLCIIISIKCFNMSLRLIFMGNMHIFINYEIYFQNILWNPAGIPVKLTFLKIRFQLNWKIWFPVPDLKTLTQL